MAMDSSTINEMGAVSAHFGPRAMVVLNLSEGGAALKFADGEEIPKDFKPDAQVDVSFEIHKKLYPLTVSVRGVVGHRLHCQFLSKPPAFELALKEFFVPKALGASLSRNESLSDHPEVQALVPDSEWHEVWVAPNQTGLFIWFGEEDAVLKILLVSRDVAWEWAHDSGAKSGHRTVSAKGESPHQAFEINWDREMSPATKTFVQEVFSSWLGMGDDARTWIARLVDAESQVNVITEIGCSPLLRRIRKG